MFPFHTWLPDAHVEAPTAGQRDPGRRAPEDGHLRLPALLPAALPADASLHFAPWMFTLAVIGIIYGAWVSTVQPDIKKLVAYSSVSHLGFVVLGLFTLTAQGMVGGIIQMVNHGLSTGALFLMVGHDLRAAPHPAHRRLRRAVEGDARLQRALPDRHACPRSGCPGSTASWASSSSCVGAFQVDRLAAVLATTGIIFAAVYLLWMYQRVMLRRGHPRGEPAADRSDPSGSGRCCCRCSLFIFWIGVYPITFTGDDRAERAGPDRPGADQGAGHRALAAR